MKHILRGAPKILVFKIAIKILDKEVYSVKNFIFSGVTGLGPANLFKNEQTSLQTFFKDSDCR